MLTSLPWLARYMRLLPRVEYYLKQIGTEAQQISNELLREQALLSLDKKAFHCYGGAVMILLAPATARRQLLALVVYLQTISDYLDNLCDRAGSTDYEAFLALHQSMLDAVNPKALPSNYYNLYQMSEGHYLTYLVQSCQNICRSLPSLPMVEKPLKDLITYYTYLQTYKHMPLSDREARLQGYLAEQVPNPHGLSWWELAAATGSTLGMFALLALASKDKLSSEEVGLLVEAYFPWICGLHILLDYLIDQEEDKSGGDLNFVSYYDDAVQAWNAMHQFLIQSHRRARKLPSASLHLLVVTGLLAMYMSDHKVQLQGYLSQARTLIRTAGSGSVPLYHLCRLTRRLKGVK